MPEKIPKQLAASSCRGFTDSDVPADRAISWLMTRTDRSRASVSRWKRKKPPPGIPDGGFFEARVIHGITALMGQPPLMQP
jgi:hypothetical protein